MLTFAVGLLILSFAVVLLGIMLDEVYDWGHCGWHEYALCGSGLPRWLCLLLWCPRLRRIENDYQFQ